MSDQKNDLIRVWQRAAIAVGNTGIRRGRRVSAYKGRRRFGSYLYGEYNLRVFAWHRLVAGLLAFPHSAEIKPRPIGEEINGEGDRLRNETVPINMSFERTQF